MRYRNLGNTGLRVSELCLGAMTFGTGFYGIGQVDQTGANKLVKRSIDGGINFFDTADIYSRGESETLLGRSIKEAKVDRAAMIIATKVRGAMSDAAGEGSGDVNNVGLSRQHIIASCEASLKRLGTDYIDLYQIHGPDHMTPIEETMSALSTLVGDGKVRYVGCSNLTAWQLMKANAVADARGFERFVSHQAYYSLLGRDLELELLPICREEKVGVLVWSPLAGGFLSGKFRRSKESPSDSRRTSFDFPPIDKERGYDLIELMDGMAKEKGVTIAQIALRWCLEERAVSTVIIGAKRMDQLEDNLGAVEVELSVEDLAKLEKATELPNVYPHWIIGMMQRK